LVTEHGFMLLLLICTLIAAFIWLMRVPRFTHALERSLIRLPFIREFMRSYSLSLISRTLSTLLTSGISLVSALQYVGNQSRAYRDALDEVGMRVNEGQRLSVAMATHPLLFPHTFVEL